VERDEERRDMDRVAAYPGHRLVVIRGGDSEHGAINGAGSSRASGVGRSALSGRENLLGQVSEAAKMTIRSTPFANAPWIISRLPSRRPPESATPNRRTPPCWNG